MKRKLIALFGALSLAALPLVCVSAQPVSDMDEGEAFRSGFPPEIMEGRGGDLEKHRGEMTGGAVRSGGFKGSVRQGGRKSAAGARIGGFGMGGGAAGPGFFDEDEIMGQIKKYDPAFCSKLEGLKKSARPKYKMAIMMAGRALGVAKMENDEGLARDSVRMVFLELETKELAMKHDKAADSAKTAIKADLKAKIAELFDLRLRGQELRVKRMENDLARLRKNLETRRSSKNKIVDQRVEQMVGESFGW